MHYKKEIKENLLCMHSKFKLEIMFKKTQFIFILLMAFISHISLGQIQISQEVYQAIQAGEKLNFDVKEKAYQVSKTELEYDKIKHKYIPTLSATAGLAHFKNDGVLDLAPVGLPLLPIQLFEGSQAFGAQGNVVGAGLMANSVLYSGGQIPKAKKALKTKAEAESLLMEATYDEITIQIIEAFDNLKVLEHVEKLLDESSKRLDTETNRVNKAIENGLAIPYDRDKILLASLELQAKRQEAEGKKKVLLDQIEFLTGLKASQSQNTNHIFEEVALLGLEEIKVSDKKELEALDLLIEAQTLNVEREKNSILPQAALFGGLQYAQIFDTKLKLKDLPLTGNDLTSKIVKTEIWPNWIIGVGLKWNIFEGMQRSHRVEEAKLTKDLLSEKHSDAEKKFNLLLAKQKSDLNTQNGILAIAKQRKKVAEQNLNRAIKQYQNGLLSINDRLASENDYYSAALGLAQETAKQRKLSMEVLATSGQLNKSLEIK